MKSISLIISFLLLNLSVSAASLKFSESVWDFGTIKEEGGDVTHTFTMENRGSNPVVIYNIQTSCGCTTTKYSHKPLMKGETSTIEIAFDPRFRPGHFMKDIYVYTSAESDPIILKIKGDVTPRTLSLEERYPYNINKEMRIGSTYTTFRAVPVGRLVQQSVEFKNLVDREQKIEFRPRTKETPLRLYYDETVAGGANSSVEIGYYVEGGRGSLADTVDIFVNGIKTNKSLYIKGLIVE